LPVTTGSESPLPRKPIDRVVGPFVRFLHVETASGIVLLLATITALVLANSQWQDTVHEFWATEIGLQIGTFHAHHSLKHWINDALMVLFFFLIGLEVKRELVLGELRDLRRAALPIAAAIGGMIAPAGIYLLVQFGREAQDGWGIPMATDIAFVVGCMAVLGSRVPASLRIMLLSLAIADDIGAILVIAIGYTSGVSWGWLGFGFGMIAFIVLMTHLGVRSLFAYTIAGIALWVAFYESGIHATIAGVILGLMTPARSWLSESALADVLERSTNVIKGGEWKELPHRAQRIARLQWATREAISPLEYLESALHPWVAYGVIPIFALANADVTIASSDAVSLTSIAVILGLVLGKPIGVLGASWIAVKLGIARLPDVGGWPMIAAGGCLAGIGFTMALFIAELALEDSLLTTAKLGVLLGSFISAVIGMVLIYVLSSKSQPELLSS